MSGKPSWQSLLSSGGDNTRFAGGIAQWWDTDLSSVTIKPREVSTFPPTSRRSKHGPSSSRHRCEPRSAYAEYWATLPPKKRIVSKVSSRTLMSPSHGPRPLANCGRNFGLLWKRWTDFGNTLLDIQEPEMWTNSITWTRLLYAWVRPWSRYRSGYGFRELQNF